MNDERAEAHVEDVLVTGTEDCLFLNVASPVIKTI
jgi:carboxylesterase type B